MRSIRTSLSFWLMALVLVTSSLSLLSSYHVAKRYEGQIMDATLARRARGVISLIEEFPGDRPEEAAQWALESYSLFGLDAPAQWQKPSSAPVAGSRITSTTLNVRFVLGDQCYTPHMPGQRCKFFDSEQLLSGFHNLIADGEEWRVYTVYSPAKDAWVQAGYPVAVADALLAEAMWLSWTNKLLILLPVSSLLGLLIISVTLRPLRRLARQLTKHPEGELPSPDGLRSELQPIVSAIANSRQAADKLKAQQLLTAEEITQRSLAYLEESRAAVHVDERETALRHLERLERQLRLAENMVHLEMQPQPEAESFSLYRELVLVVGRYQELARALKIDLALRPEQHAVMLHMPLRSMQIMLDNLMESAIRHAPSGSEITIRLCQGQDRQPRLVFNCAKLPYADLTLRTNGASPYRNAFATPNQIGLARKVAERYGIALRPSQCDRFGGARLICELPPDLIA